MDDIDRRVLELESRFYRHGGRKVQAIANELDLSPTQYAYHLHRAVDDPAACIAFPQLTGRLRRMRGERLRARTSRRARRSSTHDWRTNNERVDTRRVDS